MVYRLYIVYIDVYRLRSKATSALGCTRDSAAFPSLRRQLRKAERTEWSSFPRGSMPHLVASCRPSWCPAYAPHGLSSCAIFPLRPFLSELAYVSWTLRSHLQSLSLSMTPLRPIQARYKTRHLSSQKLSTHSLLQMWHGRIAIEPRLHLGGVVALFLQLAQDFLHLSLPSFSQMGSQ